jgi:hypothetical protein
MSRDVLDPLLALRKPPAMAVAEGFFERIMGPGPPELMDLFHVFDALLSPRRELADEELAVPDLDLEEPGPRSGFSPATVAAARALLESTRRRPARLSELLREARRSPECRDDVVQLVRLGVLWAFAPDSTGHPQTSVVPERMRSVRDGVELHDPEFGGDDLLVDAGG